MESHPRVEASTRSEPQSDSEVDGHVLPGDDGVDVTLIRWMLSLTVMERIATLQAQADALMKLRNAAAER
ncbi:MAG: hypothetical protein AAF726_09770 [Planctomycetota bacterium]